MLHSGMQSDMVVVQLLFTLHARKHPALQSTSVLCTHVCQLVTLLQQTLSVFISICGRVKVQYSQFENSTASTRTAGLSCLKANEVGQTYDLI